MEFTLKGGHNDGKRVFTNIKEEGQRWDVEIPQDEPMILALTVSETTFEVETYIAVRRCKNTHCWLELHIK